MNDDARDIIQAIDSDDLEAASKLFPYVRQALTAYQWVKRKRMSLFLRTLAKSEEKLDDRQKETFKRIISSEGGKELLAEYADSVIRTSSQTSIAALAILYGDVENEKYPAAFKSVAAIALEGISETAIDLFLALTQGQRVSRLVDDEGPYKIYFCSDHLLSFFPHLSHLRGQPEETVIIVNELIRRNLLLPDRPQARIAGDDFSIPYGLSETSQQFEKLLNSARGHIATSDKD